MYWFWMNVPAAAVFFAAWTGIPLWLVFKHPDTASEPREAKIQLQPGTAENASRHPSDSRQLAGAGR